jgi:phosphatidylinositol 4-kinase B
LSKDVDFFNPFSFQVCIPLWCDSSDAERPSNGLSEPHHRVVRIPPGESVVLNSAERAPFLLIVEILHGDLDFDPSRGENKEVLRKMVLKEIGHREVSSELPDWTGGLGVGTSVSGFKDDTGQDALDTDHGEVPSIGTIVPPTPVTPFQEDPEEEVDVVEQLYGADLSLRPQAAALNDSIALAVVRKNKDLDVEAMPSSPALGPQLSTHASFPEHIRTLSDTRSLHTSSNNHPPFTSSSTVSSNGHARAPLSLEDYSERMRTAAVMLAQLNSNVVREPVTTISPGTAPVTIEATVPPTALSWIPGSSWLPGLGTAGPATGTGSDANPPAMRMRLQRSEAQTIRDRIMQEMLALEEERMERMRASDENGIMNLRDIARSAKTAEDEGIIRRELNKADPSAAVFRESWATKKV